MLDFAPLIPWLSAIALLTSVGSVLWNLFQSPAKKNESELAGLRTAVGDVDDKVDGIGGRVSTLETVIRQLPDKDSMHQLELSLVKVTGELNTLSERLRPIDMLSQRLQEVLLDRAK